MSPFFPYLSLLGALACAILGIFVLSRNPRSTANIAFAVGMTAFAVMEFGKFLSAFVPPETSALPIGRIRLGGELILPVAWLIFSSHRIQSAPAGFARWRWMGMLTVCLLSAFFFAILVLGVPLPGGIAQQKWQYWMSAYMILGLTAAVANFEVTLRSADHPRRWKLKYLFLGVGSILAIRIFIHSQRLLFPAAPPAYPEIASTVVIIGCAFIAFSLVRHQLLDVDVFVSRYFAYNSFTVAAVGIYLLVVGLTAGAIRKFGGSFFDYWGILFVLSSILFLIAALLSTTVQKKLRIFINRNFYRNRYDYHKEWLSLTERLGSKVEVRDLVPPIMSLFRDTLWIGKTGLWLSDEQGMRFRAANPSGNSDADEIRWDAGLLRFLRERDYPVRIGELLAEADSGSGAFRQLSAFQEDGFLVMAPMTVGNRLVGILGLGDSKSGHPLDGEDLDLINTVAKQAASSILGAELSGRLVKAKELEAFHSFSAFVLHDLKNFMALLSLFVENADRNLDRPEFRADAIRGISQTLEKMKRLMERLSALSREPRLERVPVDLNKLVQEVFDEMRGSIGSKTVETLGDLPEIHADPAQIRNVLTNLIRNAEDAAGEKGEIRLSTFERNGQVVLTVEDNGCGMTSEFIEESLFRPFTTTKSDGFGIGLYQVKRIVEAHQGGIEVKSAVGRGTTFRIRLPQAGG